MAVQLNPYLSFRESARAAMEFYQSVFGGELEVMTFADMHASDDPAEADKVMHSSLQADNGLVLMAADTPNSMDAPSLEGVQISLSGDDESVLRGYWEVLSGDGHVIQPLEQAPWGDHFGMCTDTFGVMWMVNITGQG